MPEVTTPYIEVTQHGLSLLLTKLPASILTGIAYASVRGKDNEEGAVQRYLNPSRINAIKEFTVNGGQFPNAIVLNWIGTEPPLRKNNGQLTIPDVTRAAQLIDGQHRVAGIKAAIEGREDLATLEIPVAIYEGLNTQQCANIFLAINTEQKPVPRSLVFDLYGIANEQHIDQAAFRARDIVMALHEDAQSPYYDLIKLPGSPRRKGGIALSTAVTAIKPIVEDKGDLDQIGIRELETQKQVMLNYFSAIKEKYGDDAWSASSNAFMYAAGFVGALEFFRKRFIPYCTTRQSFAKSTFFDALKLQPSELIVQEEVKGIGGKDAPKVIFERLNSVFEPEETNQTMQF